MIDEGFEVSEEEEGERQIALNIGTGLELLMDKGQQPESSPRDTILPSNPTTAIPSEFPTPRESPAKDLIK